MGRPYTRLKNCPPGASWTCRPGPGLRPPRPMERARARIMRTRIAYRAQHGRTPAPSCAPSRLQSRLEGPKGRPLAGHLNATSSSCWPRRDPQLLRNRRGRPVLACSQRSSHPRRAGSWTPGPPPAGAATSTLEGGAGQDTRRANGQDERPAPARACEGRAAAGAGQLPRGTGWPCRLCRLCRQFHFILFFVSPPTFSGLHLHHRAKEIRTKAAGIVRILVRKFAKVLIISVSCGA